MDLYNYNHVLFELEQLDEYRVDGKFVLVNEKQEDFKFDNIFDVIEFLLNQS